MSAAGQSLAAARDCDASVGGAICGASNPAVPRALFVETIILRHIQQSTTAHDDEFYAISCESAPLKLCESG